jgi:hypothetical protein
MASGVLAVNDRLRVISPPHAEGRFFASLGIQRRQRAALPTLTHSAHRQRQPPFSEAPGLARGDRADESNAKPPRRQQPPLTYLHARRVHCTGPGTLGGNPNRGGCVPPRLMPDRSEQHTREQMREVCEHAVR